MVTTNVMSETSRVGRWAMRVEVAPSDRSRRSLTESDSEHRSHALAAWLLDEWKRERAGQGGER